MKFLKKKINNLKLRLYKYLVYQILESCPQCLKEYQKEIYRSEEKFKIDNFKAFKELEKNPYIIYEN